MTIRPEEPTIQEWLFNDAPRGLRLEAVEKPPDLLDKLVAEANAVTERIRFQIPQVHLFAQTLSAALKARAPQGRK